MVNDTSRRPAWRRRLAVVTFVSALALHAAFIVQGGSDPHKRFGFRPFNDSDEWQVDIVRVTADGESLPITDGTWAYEWNELVGAKKLLSPWRSHHASGGAAGTIDLLDKALDWVVENIPDDPDTVRLDATVTVVHNRDDPRVTMLRGAQRRAQR